MSDVICVYEDWRNARETLLKRPRRFATETVPQSVLEGIRRRFGADLTPEQAVSRVLNDVAERGDDALSEWTRKIDGVLPDPMEVAREACEAAYRALPADLAAAMEVAAGRIRDFHTRQPIPAWATDAMGGTLGQRWSPLQRVGIYVPGGTAPLPSSLLMTAIPAKVAGVDEVIVCTPSGREAGGVAAVVLAAAHVADVDRLFALGGAQAIAAMAYGTESVPRVDKIVGAGGLFVTLAKRQVYGAVGLDMLAGPTETVIIADDSADPVWVAADLLAQAEHDALATAILLTPSRELAGQVQAEIQRQVVTLERSQIMTESLGTRGGIVLTPDLDTAAALANDYAPEHLCLSVRDPGAFASRFRNAGGLFLGEHSFEVLGDYVAGPSHVMPTMGTARFASPVNVLDFCRVTSVISLDRATAARLAPAAARIARAEGLTAHAAAAECREGSDLESH